jgi:AraC family transcriptional regulator
MAHYEVVLRRREIAEFDLMEAVYAPNAMVSKHSHEQANFCIALQGACSESYGRRTREYERFSLDFLPAHQVHSLKFQSSGMRCFSIDIAPRWVQQMRDYSLPVDISLHTQGGPLAALFMRLYEEFRTSDQASFLAIEGLALEMLVKVSRLQSKTVDRKPPHWLEQAKEILHADCSTSVTLSSIAATVGVHPVHLARTFSKHYRSTIGEYLRRLRIEFSCRELSASDRSLIEIALAAGFSSQSHFSTVFKRYTGLTPAQYRSMSHFS